MVALTPSPPHPFEWYTIPIWLSPLPPWNELACGMFGWFGFRPSSNGRACDHPPPFLWNGVLIFEGFDLAREHSTLSRLRAEFFLASCYVLLRSKRRLDFPPPPHTGTVPLLKRNRNLPGGMGNAGACGFALVWIGARMALKLLSGPTAVQQTAAGTTGSCCKGSYAAIRWIA